MSPRRKAGAQEPDPIAYWQTIAAEADAAFAQAWSAQASCYSNPHMDGLDHAVIAAQAALSEAVRTRAHARLAAAIAIRESTTGNSKP